MTKVKIRSGLLWRWVTGGTLSRPEKIRSRAALKLELGHRVKESDEFGQRINAI